MGRSAPSGDPTADRALAPASSREEEREANKLMGAGLGLGAFGAISAALLGAVCPACVIAGPALLGYGVYKRVQCARAKRKECAEPTVTLSDPIRQ